MAVQRNAAGANVNMDPTQLPDDTLRDMPIRRLNRLFRQYYIPPIMRMTIKHKRRKLKNRIYSQNYRARKRQQLQALRVQVRAMMNVNRRG